MSGSKRGTARIGVLVPFTNTNLEPDLALMCPGDVTMHFARIGGYDADEIPDSRQMSGLATTDMEEPLRLLSGVAPDVVLYGCTSATLSLGRAFDRKLAGDIRSATGARTITAAGALVHALNAISAHRIAFASPYVSVLNDEAIAFLSDAGIETVSRADLPYALGNSEQGMMTPDDVIELGLRADSASAQAIALSCTDMRAVEAIDALEQQTGKPVITSNQAMMYQALSELGMGFKNKGFGRLMECVSLNSDMTGGPKVGGAFLP